MLSVHKSLSYPLVRFTALSLLPSFGKIKQIHLIDTFLTVYARGTDKEVAEGYWGYPNKYEEIRAWICGAGSRMPNTECRMLNAEDRIPNILG